MNIHGKHVAYATEHNCGNTRIKELEESKKEINLKVEWKGGGGQEEHTEEERLANT